MSGIALAIERSWYGSPGVLWLLTPLEWAFAIATSLRRSLFRSGFLKSYHPGCAVIVVGNITAGGTGKTPVVQALASSFMQKGISVAIVSRGYGSARQQGSSILQGGVSRVEPHSDPGEVGDEPILLAESVGCPVYVGKDRVAAARRACADGADLIVCDDGLQHYRLQRDVEIAVTDARSPVGNGHLLPVGPLREGRWRLEAVDFVLEHSGNNVDRALIYAPAGFRSLGSGETRSPADPGFGPEVHALAAIARPERFFATLRSLGFDVQEHPMRDHSKLRREDLALLHDRPLIITAKDATKVPEHAHPDIWVLDMEMSLPKAFLTNLAERLRSTGVPGL